MSDVNVDQIVKRACVAYDQGQVSAGDLNELFSHLAREAFPGDRDYVAKAMSTRWGMDLINKSASAHRTDMQLIGGHNDEVMKLLKRAPRAVDADKDRSVADGSGGQRRSDNAATNTRRQMHSDIPPSTVQGPSQFEPSYDHLMKFKVALLNYLKTNPRCSYEAAIDAVGSQHHIAEKKGEIERFRSMAR
jgi:hypothetical protein